MILGLGLPEILVILFIVLLIFGPKNLPKLGKSLGKTVKNVREGMEDGDASETKEEKSDKAANVVIEKTSEVGDAVKEPATSYKDAVNGKDDDAEDAEDAQPAAEASEDAVFCSKCGAKNPADAAFCSKCGAKLAD